MPKVVYNNDYGGFSLSPEACRLLNERKGREVVNENYGYVWDLPRHDPDLVAVVEAIGCKAASGSFASLAIREVQNEYRVCEYDGAEWVEEPHTIEWETSK